MSYPSSAGETLPRHGYEQQESSADTTSYLQDQATSQGNLASILTSWDVASERVATVTLQCLSKDMDMEMSYVSILSALTVLQSMQDQPPEFNDTSLHVDSKLLDSKKEIAKTFSQILIIMCRSNIAEGLGKETLRQGVMSPEALYTQFYGSIQEAGYGLEDGAHLAMAQYWVEHRKIEEAQDCLARIDAATWTGPIYREAIACFLFSKPRQLQEADSMLQKYIESLKILEQPVSDEESKIRTWYKLQVDASKWEEVKARYERRRTRLVDGPPNSERVSVDTDPESRLTPQALQQHLLQEQQASPSKQFSHVRSKSITSSTTTSSYRRSPLSQHGYASSEHRKSSSGQRTPPVAPSWPSGAPAALSSSTSVAASAPSGGTFSFLSSLGFTKSSDAETAQTPSAALPSRFNVNRHLTVLDNGMLEESINFNEFEYGWKQIYEKMGPTLEDADTPKIAMKLCRRAFLGHSGLDQAQPGSPNLTARDIHFNDESLSQEATTSSRSNRDAEIWEARAWVIYNKVMMNTHTFLSNNTGSTIHSQALAASGNSTGGNLAARNTSHTSSNSPAPLSVFFHDILTIAVHSPELSSRYLKAFKVYSAMRSDQHFQHQIRDPFVMSCTIKAIYDAALAVIHNPEQNMFPPLEKRTAATRRQRRSSSLSLNRAQPMTLGPLMDLAFEIYADMRNVGPIRHLPALTSLTPTSPVNKGCKAPSPTASTNDPLDLGTASIMSISVFQDLNPTLKPNPQARRLPADLYLALLHLCIHVPVSRISSQVVMTIVDDMAAGSRGQREYLDCHVTAALQCYHDTWMCPIDAEAAGESSPLDLQQKKCEYREWMFKSDEQVQEHITASKRVSCASSVGCGDGTDVESTVNDLTKQQESCTLDEDQQDQESTCNDRLYWDLWSMEDAALKNVQYSRTKARMLWSHVAQALL